jgi:PBSX family phage terminase large subunit
MKLLSNYKPLFVLNPKTRYFIITGGRGSAKSYHLAVFLLNLTYEKNEVILFTRWTMTSAHISIIPEFLEKIELLSKEADFEITKTEIINKLTGSRILFRGIKTSQGTATANLKSIQGVTCWVMDEAEELQDEDVFDKIDLSIRAKNKANRVILVMNPSFRQHFVHKRWFEQKRTDTTYIHTTYKDNIENLSESFLDQAEQLKQTNILRYNHIFLGEWLDNASGMFWNFDLINTNRVQTIPTIKRKIIALDPAVTNTATSDETGIVIVGEGVDGLYYILEDLSGKYTPNEWATIAVNAYHEHKANTIVGEANNGGDLIETVIKQVDKNVHYKKVTATKSKGSRAEPIYALYQQNKVKHYGYLTKLESEMITFNPSNIKTSPNRLDAMVWGVTALVDLTPSTSNVTTKHVRPQSNERGLERVL